ncbi:MAG: class I SAM-dependent methyltransferase [Planctomycetes bacterium]|nr:class I SAM-dependent methyltransferase [Planctomycetota bacterium]
MRLRDAKEKYVNPERASKYRARNSEDTRRSRREAGLVLRALSTFDLLPGAKVLDVPSGAGRWSKLLTDRGFDVVGADYSLEMLEYASEFAPGASFVRADGFRLPFAEGSFDLVFCFRMIHHFEAQAVCGTLIPELLRVSKRFVLASFFHPLSMHGLKRRLSSMISGKAHSRFSLPPSEIVSASLGAGARNVTFFPEGRFLHELWLAKIEK